MTVTVWYLNNSDDPKAVDYTDSVAIDCRDAEGKTLNDINRFGVLIENAEPRFWIPPHRIIRVVFPAKEKA